MKEENIRHSPYCNLHSQKSDSNHLMPFTNCGSFGGSGKSPIIGWLPNVIVSLRTFKSAVHKLLNDHGGQMPLLSFMDCYKCCIFNDNSSGSNGHRGNAHNLLLSQSNAASNGSNGHNSTDLSYQLIIDNENGVSLEHLITCAQDVQIQYNESFFKQLQWENDKSKPLNLQSRNSTNISKNRQSFDARCVNDQTDGYCNELDDSVEESQRKMNQFSHEVVELFKG